MTDRRMDTALLTFPDLDYDGDGAVDASSSFNACIFSGPEWSGISRTNRDVTASCDPAELDDWDNLVRTMAAGKIINMGTLTFGIDWDPGLDAADTTTGDAVGGKLFAAFKLGGPFNVTVTVPKEGTETTGPIITIPVIFQSFQPMGEVLAEGEGNRLHAICVFDIAGDLTLTKAA